MNSEYYLLANPNYLKKNKRKTTIDDELFLLLQRKYPEYNFNIEDFDYLILKIENLINEIHIEKIVYELIDTIDE
tara:strand:- start:469 stop:693 length:225 start_codon:yes stop_codon:yes gene_type:complete